MASHQELIAGFETAGEAEVRRRVTSNAYDGEHLAHALQWLHDVGATRTAGDTPEAREARRRDSLRQIDGLIRASLAATVAVALCGAALWAFQALGHAG